METATVPSPVQSKPGERTCPEPTPPTPEWGRSFHARPPADAATPGSGASAFVDGNGRTGRALNLLYLVDKGLLDIPVLYLSRHFIRNKALYYRVVSPDVV